MNLTDKARQEMKRYYSTPEMKKKRNEYARLRYARKREEINAYMRAWRKNNPDKVQAYHARYWENKALEREKTVNNGNPGDNQ